MSRHIALLAIEGVPLVVPGDDIARLLIAALERMRESLHDGDIVVVTQKIVSKAEDRYRDLTQVTPSPRAIALAERTGKDARLVELILAEARAVIRARPGVLIVEHRLGFIHANGGIDQSNVGNGEHVLLLPADPDGTAARLRDDLAAHYRKRIAVIINDSSGRAWRNGVIGFAIGCAGIAPLVDLVGTPDLFGRRLQNTQVAVADELAAAASVLMGQAGEALPAVVIRGADCLPGSDGARALLRDPALDLFRD